MPAMTFSRDVSVETGLQASAPAALDYKRKMSDEFQSVSSVPAATIVPAAPNSPGNKRLLSDDVQSSTAAPALAPTVLDYKRTLSDETPSLLRRRSNSNERPMSPARVASPSKLSHQHNFTFDHPASPTSSLAPRTQPPASPTASLTPRTQAPASPTLTAVPTKRRSATLSESVLETTFMRHHSIATTSGDGIERPTPTVNEYGVMVYNTPSPSHSPRGSLAKRQSLELSPRHNIDVPLDARTRRIRELMDPNYDKSELTETNSESSTCKPANRTRSDSLPTFVPGAEAGGF